MRRILRILGLALLAPFALAGTYLGAAAAAGLLPHGAATDPAPKQVDIYLHSNGVHADLLLPVVALDIDWRQRLPSYDDPDVANGGFPYLAFGWGDRSFYLTTPTWSDLDVTTALLALSGLDGTVMHVQSASPPPLGPRSAKLSLTADQYHQLVEYIDQSFQHDPAGAPIPIAGAHYYGRHDAFYEARGHYSLFNTCNEWTRGALARAGQRTAAWAPFDIALFHQIRT
jgi:uncharacterized protein (TIGR02117 family)